MAHEAANGFIAPFPDDCEFEVTEQSRKIKKTTHNPTGVFVHADYERVYLNYSGVPSMYSLELPSEPAILRELAEALELMADRIEQRRGG